MTRNRLLLIIPLFLFAACATQNNSVIPASAKARIGTTKKIRITAYTHTEAGGIHNAVGKHLCTGKVNSAAADWSRFPLGTKFKIISTGQVCKIDDYGGALVGTNTIDLYEPTRRKMHRWGVRYEDIKILEWGSPRKSLEVLMPRTRSRHVREMVENLREQVTPLPKKFHRISG